MNVSKKQKFFIGFIITSTVFFGIFQNFTSQEQAQLAQAKRQLNNIVVPNIFANCSQAGTTADGRPAANQYKCNEYPFGLTSIGMSPSAYNTFMAANPALTPVKHIGTISLPPNPTKLGNPRTKLPINPVSATLLLPNCHFPPKLNLELGHITGSHTLNNILQSKISIESSQCN